MIYCLSLWWIVKCRLLDTGVVQGYGDDHLIQGNTSWTYTYRPASDCDDCDDDDCHDDDVKQ